MRRILLVEDEKMLIDMYTEKLKTSGFKVTSVFEAKEGLEIAKKEKPDLIILDILLPRENGIYFLEQWKDDPEISSIPIIVFSNYDDPEAKKAAILLGAKEYLIKSNYTPKEIIERIKKYLE